MSIVTNPLFLLAIGFCVFFGDTAIHAKEVIRIICYGAVALFALICLIVLVLGLK